MNPSCSRRFCFCINGFIYLDHPAAEKGRQHDRTCRLMFVSPHMMCSFTQSLIPPDQDGLTVLPRPPGGSSVAKSPSWDTAPSSLQLPCSLYILMNVTSRVHGLLLNPTSNQDALLRPLLMKALETHLGCRIQTMPQNLLT